MKQWPSRYAISKYIDYLGPSMSRDLSAAFFQGQDEAFDELRRVDSPGVAVGEVASRLATWVAEEAP
jgi:hypothetical protein